MSTHEGEALYRRFIEEVFNRGDFSHLNELFTPDYKIWLGQREPKVGFEAVRASATMFRNAFPDLHIAIDAVLMEGNTVAARARLTGTHQGAFLGRPPSGRRVSVTNMTMLHIRDGKIAESWVVDDIQGLLRQLGAASTSAAA